MKRVYVVYAIVIGLTVLHIYQLKIPALLPATFNLSALDPLYPVWKDDMIVRSVVASLSQDPFDKGPVFIARVFHNKVTAAVEVAFQNIARPLDGAFLFTFPGQVSTYDSYYKPPMLFPFELLLFLGACIAFIQKPIYRRFTLVNVSMWFFIITLFFMAITAPVMHSFKLIVLVCAVRFFYISVLQVLLWKDQKKK